MPLWKGTERLKVPKARSRCEQTFPRDAQRNTHFSEVPLQAYSTSRIFLTRDQNYLCFREAGEPGRMLPSRTSDELKLAAHPVGKSLTTGGRRKPYIDGKGVHL